MDFINKQRLVESKRWGAHAHREGPEPAADVNQGDHAAPARRDVVPNALGVAVAAVRDDISRGARAASV